MSAEEIVAQSGGETAFFMWPERQTVFAERAMRLRQLAQGHAMQDFLQFMAELALAQQAALNTMTAVPLPDAAALDAAARQGLPPLPATDWPRDAAWHGVLRQLAAALQGKSAGADAVLAQLATAEPAQLEQQADALLGGMAHSLDMGSAPLIAAALQVYWTHMVLAVQQQHLAQGQPFGRVDDETRCPCCGTRPVASLTRMTGTTNGQRYLHCALCSVQWHMVRIRCTQCGTTEGIAYQSLDVADAPAHDGPHRAAAILAECCATCGYYLKIMHTERQPMIEAVADDLASLTLDLLVADSGWHRHGANLLFLFGDPDNPPPRPP
jgi:FdhE protein